MEAARDLEKGGIDARIINIHTVKPIVEDIIILAAAECGAIVTAEEHQIYGGLGSAVAEVVVKNNAVPMEFVGIQDSFGRSGKPDELMATYHLKAPDITAAVKKVLQRK